MISCVKLLVIRELLARREKPKHAGQVTLVSTHPPSCHLLIIILPPDHNFLLRPKNMFMEQNFSHIMHLRAVILGVS